MLVKEIILIDRIIGMVIEKRITNVVSRSMRGGTRVRRPSLPLTDWLAPSQRPQTDGQLTTADKHLSQGFSRSPHSRQIFGMQSRHVMLLCALTRRANGGKNDPTGNLAATLF